MKPSTRHHVNKHSSARHFRHDLRTHAAANYRQPMRGGWRL